jgi:hypothetical protein
MNVALLGALFPSKTSVSGAVSQWRKVAFPWRSNITGRGRSYPAASISRTEKYVIQALSSISSAGAGGDIFHCSISRSHSSMERP